MKTAVLAFTRCGLEVARRVKAVLGEADLFLGGAAAQAGGHTSDGWSLIPEGGLTGAVSSLWGRYRAFVFVSATGIAVRAIAPNLRGKAADPAVLAIDDQARFVISLISGHLGGANDLAVRLAPKLGATAVITTATDARGAVAPDLLVRDYGWIPDPPSAMKAIAAALADGREVSFYAESEFISALETRLGTPVGVLPVTTAANTAVPAVSGPTVLVTARRVDLTDPQVVALRPKHVVAGIGCRRGISAQAVAGAVRAALKTAGLVESGLGCLASIDLKSDETGLLEAARLFGIPARFVPREDIRKINAVYSRSTFVRQATGVEGVCEPVAMLIADTRNLALEKTIFPEFPGVTVALAAAGFQACRSWGSARETRSI